MFDEETGLFYGRNGRVISISPVLTKLLGCLLAHKNSVVSYKILLKEVWNEDNYDAHMRAILRNAVYKLNNQLYNYIKIKSKNGVGYYIEGK